MLGINHNLLLARGSTMVNAKAVTVKWNWYVAPVSHPATFCMLLNFIQTLSVVQVLFFSVVVNSKVCSPLFALSCNDIF